MKAAYIFLVLFGLVMASIVHADHSITMQYNGECPPDNEVHVSCWDLTGLVHISADMQIGETRTFSVPNSVGTLVCIIKCEGKEVYRKRYEFPGTGAKAVPGYPYDIYRGGNLPEGTDINDTINETLRDPSKCGNGDVDAGEACDGSKGCTDPAKPTCYECTYCGCNDAKQCVQISGAMQCGTYGCAAYERPKFSVECLDGICAYPRKCVLDPECIDKYQEERDKKVESSKQQYAMSPAFASDKELVQTVLYEKFQGESPEVPLDAFGGTITDYLDVGESETYTLNGEIFSMSLINVDAGLITYSHNGMEYYAEEGETITLANGAELFTYSVGSPAIGADAGVYFHINTLDENDMHYVMLAGDYNPDTGEISWPPKEQEPFTPTQDSTIDPPFWLQPGEKAHLVCSQLNSCTWEKGEGEDQCHHSEDCTEERMKELEGETTVQPPPTTTVDTGQNYHGACSSGGYCIRAEGPGTDECASDSDCWDGRQLPQAEDPNDNKHTACQDKRCIYVEGEGTDECAGHWNCDSSYPLPSTQISTCFGTMCRANPSDMPISGKVCRTSMDCGGLGLFSSMLGGSDIEEGKSMKSPFKELLGNERVNFIADAETAHIILKEGVIVEAGDGEVPDNTVNVRTSVQTIERIQLGETNVEEAIYEDNIKIEGEGFFNGIKFWFAEMVYDMFYNAEATDAPADVN